MLRFCSFYFYDALMPDPNLAPRPAEAAAGGFVLYFAAALFNGRQTCFNTRLVEGLEARGYQTQFPQRDGFEFGHLAQALGGKLPPDKIDAAVQSIIYLLDMGFFLPACDIMLANLDEPQDEGVMVEVAYAKLIGRHVIGYRTDVRSPYGIRAGHFGGMHFFPACQTHQFIAHYMPAKTPQARDAQMNALIEKLDAAIKSANLLPANGSLPEYAANNPNLQPVLKCANRLFRNIEDIHSETGLAEIAARYVGDLAIYEAIKPKMIDG